MKLYRFCLIQLKRNKVRRFFAILLMTFSLAFLGLSVFLSQMNKKEDITYQLLDSYSDKLINFSQSNDGLSKEQVEQLTGAFPDRKYFVSSGFGSLFSSVFIEKEGKNPLSRFTMYKDVPLNPDGSVGYSSEEDMLSREHVDYREKFLVYSV